MKVLESFLIALGIKVDEKSFQKADSAFGGLTKTALQFGAVLAGKLAIDKVVGDFKNAGTELNNFNKLTGLSTQNVQSLGQALKAQGGNASDAFAAMLKMQDLMASPITGDTGWFGEVAKLGLNPDAIVGAQDTAEALANIAGEFEHMTSLNQRLAGKALGLDDSTVRLLMRGRAEVEKQLDSRGKLAVMTQKQIEDAARLTQATSELDQVFTDIGNTIAGELAPAFAEMAEDFVEFYRNNKELIDSGLKEFFGGVADNVELVSVAIALLGGSAALKGLATLRAIVGLSGAAATAATAAGAGAAAAGAGAGGASMLAVAGGSAAAVLYSSKLNEGEDTELLNNRLKKGGAEAAGATIDYFRQKGWTQEQAMGIAANVQQESGFKATAVGDGGDAYGLAQWHKDRQADFAKFSGKDIRKSTGIEQLDFINHELTRGREKSAGDQLRMTTNAYDAGSVVSSQYERPADRLGEASRRGELAQSYAPDPAQKLTPVDPPVQVVVSQMAHPAEPQKDLQQPPAAAKDAKPQESFLERTKTWLDSYRKNSREDTKSDVVDTAAPAVRPDIAPTAQEKRPATAPSLVPKYQAPERAPPERSAPREYDVTSVVPASKDAAQSPTSATAQAAPVQPSYTDSRVYHISGADTEKVKQVLNEQMSKMTEQTMQDFRSPEQ